MKPKEKQMKHRLSKSNTVLFFAVLLIFSACLLETDAFARFGRGGSFGSRGSRSFSMPKRSYSPDQGYSRPGTRDGAPSSVRPGQPGGGFFRNFGGGIFGGMMGGLLGGMLFGRMGGGFGGSGIGMLEIILFAAIGYGLFRMLGKRRQYAQGNMNYSTPPEYQGGEPLGVHRETENGPTGVARMDPGFDGEQFKESIMDLFFKVQASWMNKDLSTARPYLTEDMQRLFQKDMDDLIREKKTNHLENIAVRKVEITETWQEAAQDYITVLFSANLLDYTIDDAGGSIVEGSKTHPVRFEEYWTVCKGSGEKTWKLSGINQA